MAQPMMTRAELAEHCEAMCRHVTAAYPPDTHPAAPVPLILLQEALGALSLALDLVPDEGTRGETADVLDWLAAWVRSGGKGRVARYVLAEYLCGAGFTEEAVILNRTGLVVG